MTGRPQPDAETERLAEDARREKNWKRWGPYLAERQWGTVREDYSADRSCWEFFPHDHAPSRAPPAAPAPAGFLEAAGLREAERAVAHAAVELVIGVLDRLRCRRHRTC